MSLNAVVERCVDIAFYRTGKATKFLLYNHVILRTAHSLGGRAFIKSMFFPSLAASLLCNEEECRLHAARPVHCSTLEIVANAWVPIPDAWSQEMN